jgi:hypothetical protein
MITAIALMGIIVAGHANAATASATGSASSLAKSGILAALNAVPWRCVNGMTVRDVVGVGGNITGTLTCIAMTETPGFWCELAGEGGQIVAVVVYDNAGRGVRCVNRSNRCLTGRNHIFPRISTLIDDQKRKATCDISYSDCLHNKPLGWVQRGVDVIKQTRPLGTKMLPYKDPVPRWLGTATCQKSRDKCMTSAADHLEYEAAILKCGHRLQQCLLGVVSDAISNGPPKGICTP